MKFESFELWSDVLIDAYLKTPPAGYSRVTVEQLHNADLELFRQLIRATRSGIRPNHKDGTFPMEEALVTAMGNTEVRLALQPLQEMAGGSKRPRADAGEEDGENARLKKQVQDLQMQMKAMQRGDATSRGPGDRGDSAGERKGAGKKAKDRKVRMKMPKALIGCVPDDGKGNNICFGFNLSQCPAVEPSGKCNLGWHICCKPGCFKSHAYTREHKPA